MKVVHDKTRYPDIGVYEDGNERHVLGVEAKTYHLLCKEQVVNARCKVSEGLYGPGDLIVVCCYVWKHVWLHAGPRQHDALTVLLPSFVLPAPKFVESRDRYWALKGGNAKHMGNLEGRKIGSRERVNAHDPEDVGDNFGRIGRSCPPLNWHLEKLLDLPYSPYSGLGGGPVLRMYLDLLKHL